ncbi:MAG: hypothetical protein Q8R02_13485 [Hyphomonadaceae bacterium]|nr:hypothetical protein [Hyphomonadaceae bacterium]
MRVAADRSHHVEDRLATIVEFYLRDGGGVPPTAIARDMSSASVRALVANRDAIKAAGIAPQVLLLGMPEPQHRISSDHIWLRVVPRIMSTMLREELLVGSSVWFGHSPTPYTGQRGADFTLMRLNRQELKGFSLVFEGLWNASSDVGPVLRALPAPKTEALAA